MCAHIFAVSGSFARARAGLARSIDNGNFFFAVSGVLGACAGARGCKPYAARWAGHGGVAYVGGSGSNEFRAIDANSGETTGRDVFGENGAVHAIDVSGGLVGVTCADGVRVYEAAR